MANPEKVYLVWTFDGCDDELIGVFSDLALARAQVADLVKLDCREYDWELEQDGEDDLWTTKGPMYVRWWITEHPLDVLSID